MGGKDEILTHEEIWDDSALINSWNDALDEYKKYHSIHAKGGSLKDLEALELEKSKANAKQEDIEGPMESSKTILAAPQEGKNAVPTAQAPDAPPVQMMLASVKDENLKKLLMSWYYAGYYTGLYEGQQQASQSDHQ